MFLKKLKYVSAKKPACGSNFSLNQPSKSEYPVFNEGESIIFYVMKRGLLMRYNIFIGLTLLSISIVGCTKSEMYNFFYINLSDSSLNQGKSIPYGEYEMEREKLLGESSQYLAIKIQLLDDPLKVKNEIFKLLPLGTNEGIVQSTMNVNGFSCILVDGRTTTKSEKEFDYVECGVSKDISPAVKRRWTVTLVFQNKALLDIVVGP